jgi:hypothetical protein
VDCLLKLLVHHFENTSKSLQQVPDRPGGNQALAPATGYPFQWLGERVCRVLTSMNNDELLSSAFGLHPSFGAGILVSLKEITLFVLCSEKLNYLGNIKKCIADKKCTISHTGDIFQL